MRCKLGLVAVACCTLAQGSAQAAWTYQEKKDPFTDQIEYAAAAIRSSETGFLLTYLCESRGPTFGMLYFPAPVNPQALEGVKIEVRLRIDNEPPTTNVWAPRYRYERDNRQVVVPPEDVARIVYAKSRIAIGVKTGLNESITTFDSENLASTVQRVDQTCSERKPDR
jgi:hypothetical protein